MNSCRCTWTWRFGPKHWIVVILVNFRGWQLFRLSYFISFVSYLVSSLVSFNSLTTLVLSIVSRLSSLALTLVSFDSLVSFVPSLVSRLVAQNGIWVRTSLSGRSLHENYLIERDLDGLLYLYRSIHILSHLSLLTLPVVGCRGYWEIGHMCNKHDKRKYNKLLLLLFLFRF